MPVWYWPTGSTIPIQILTLSQTATTSATTGWWSNGTATATATTNPWSSLTRSATDWQMLDQLSAWTDQTSLYRSQQMTAEQAAYPQYLQVAQAQQQYQDHMQQRYGMGLYRPLESLFQPSRPALITHQDQDRRDQELYRRALAEHNEQEAARLLRLIEAREQSAAERQRLIEEQTQRHNEERQRRAVAKDRARELLVEHLTPAQRETFDRNGWFVVEGGRSKTRYRIRAVESMAANVDVINAHGAMTHRLCAHVQHGTVPLGDQLLAQKIMLELAEDDFLRIANRHAA